MRALNELSTAIKELKFDAENKSNIQLDQFKYLVEELKSLKSLEADRPLCTIKDLNVVIDQLQKLKQILYEPRLEVAKEFINLHQRSIRISPFELMEHDFRENTHSNILRYILDHNICGDASVESVCSLIIATHSLSTDRLKAKLLKKDYVVLREHNIGSGRIDILIKDERNKIVIIIENKLLSSIGEKEFDESKNTNLTQLDIYTNHFEKNPNYKSWEKYYILLNLKINRDFSHEYFKSINYHELFQLLNKIQFNDPIVDDYLLLLHSIIYNLPNKIRLKELFQNVQSGTVNLNLNLLETIQHHNYGL